MYSGEFHRCWTQTRGKYCWVPYSTKLSVRAPKWVQTEKKNQISKKDYLICPFFAFLDRIDTSGGYHSQNSFKFSHSLQRSRSRFLGCFGRTRWYFAPVDAVKVQRWKTHNSSGSSCHAQVIFALVSLKNNLCYKRKFSIFLLTRSYHDSLKYTYPGGKLEPGKLLGRILSWCADPDPSLRPLVVDCVAISLSIGARHRSTIPDNNLTQDLSESKKILSSDESNVSYEGVKTLSTAACERIASGEIVSLAEGLIEGLLFRGEGALAAGIALTQLFRIRGSDISRADLYLVGEAFFLIFYFSHLQTKN